MFRSELGELELLQAGGKKKKQPNKLLTDFSDRTAQAQKCERSDQQGLETHPDTPYPPEERVCVAKEQEQICHVVDLEESESPPPVVLIKQLPVIIELLHVCVCCKILSNVEITGEP